VRTTVVPRSHIEYATDAVTEPSAAKSVSESWSAVPGGRGNGTAATPIGTNPAAIEAMKRSRTAVPGGRA